MSFNPKYGSIPEIIIHKLALRAYYKDLCRRNKMELDRYETAEEQAKQVLEIQGQDGNWNKDAYNCGLYNGMEIIIALFQGRNPDYRELPNTPPIDSEPINMDGTPMEDVNETESN